MTKTKIYYDPIKKSLFNADTDELIYRECEDSDLSLTDVAEGREKYDSGDDFTIEDFISVELEIHDFILV